MSHSGEVQASENYELTCEEIRRRFFGEDDESVEVSKMVVHAAHVPSCSNVRSHPSKLGPTKQEERVAKSTAAKKRPRTEEAVETLNERGCNTKFNLGAADHSNSNDNQLVEELIMHHQKRHQTAGTNNVRNGMADEASAEGAPVHQSRNMQVEVDHIKSKFTIHLDPASFQASSRSFFLKAPFGTCEFMWKQT